MKTVSFKVDDATLIDFNMMAQERGFADGRELIVSWAKGQLASWRAERLVAGVQQSEYDKLQDKLE